MTAALRLDVEIDGVEHKDVRIHGAGGLLPATKDGLARLVVRIAKNDVIRIYTRWSAEGSESFDVPGNQLSIMKVRP